MAGPLEVVRKMLKGGKEPSADQLKTARGEAQRARIAAEEELRALKIGRGEVLLLGTAEELAVHDEAIRRAERGVEQGIARAQELHRAWKSAQWREAVAGAPELLDRLNAALDAVEEAEAAARAARAEAEEVRRGFDGWTVLPSEFALELPEVPQPLRSRVKRLLGDNQKLPALPRRQERPVVA